MTFEKQFVEAKLNELRGYVEELENLLKLGDAAILEDLDKLRHLERAFQLAVDIMMDINQHFIKELKFPISDDFQSTFYVLGGNNVLPKEFADRVAPVAGVRNRIVHGYETLNRRQFLKDLRINFEDFKKYIKFISEYNVKK
ncbi:MAG: hypothetical protein UX43_C0004G0039 [Candidatus Giovannonibacteria bacterium GW2011_GWB1_46_20]|uniref:DUF86 domain-containing protein n=1 Tax=Candidatus Giovannonibacteria bacterium GW2011_GWA1_44_25 TaxID=1618645 RepID=A0A0G1KU67_9BACT|nr:MAG: hypothetical protein UW15_C0006G0005 [Parcubacteria group bacterium GW2011_GWC1_44_10]KKT59892.1 MAG: hypothetical protein UW53_C0006G0039 [Candidatus Giovannonibacteria bacterium GW2011_GWA1_44_25]KKU29878.1 MAG: hypothetical protein UX43_C0004G0039 [Candidatus Giovannonibacteria bacterium GW2011_GWB1_46_20]